MTTINQKKQVQMHREEILAASYEFNTTTVRFRQETDALAIVRLGVTIGNPGLKDLLTAAQQDTVMFPNSAPAHLESGAAIIEEDEWSLTAGQTLFMMQRHNAILEAYERDDVDFLKSLEASAEYQTAFGDMSWDEAFDRYESTWIDQDETPLAS